MLHEGCGNGSFEGVYERERLRRMARKLGLRLVKPSRNPSQDDRAPRAATTAAQAGPVASAHDCGELTKVDLGKCG